MGPKEENNIKQTTHCKPFLRWAGGKTWLVKYIANYLPDEEINRYHEPFLGGGSIYFHLQPNRNAYLSDLNPQLIRTYQQVKDNVEGVIKKLREFENTKDFYYEVRDKKQFRSETSKAARFIYLNQTSFNGIYRENLKGKYNVPYGFRTKNYLDAVNLRNASDALVNANLDDGDFTEILPNIQENDFVFLDPPYTVTHYENGFIKYNSKLFKKEDQKKLAKTLDEIHSLGAKYVMTNAAHEQIRKIFKNKRDDIIELKRASLIGGKNAKRGQYSELIITNIKK